MKTIIKQWLTIGTMVVSSTVPAQALTFDLPDNDATVVGSIKESSTVLGDSLVSVARRYDLGYVELLEANPDLKASQKLPSKAPVMLPTEFILPDAPHRGLVINVAELRLYFYPPDTRQVMTFPVGIGRQGWKTPLGQTYVASKQKDPTWHVSSTIKAARLQEGVVLPDQVLPGPDNPLGGYAMHLGFPAILIHGSNDASGIGRRSSSGCIRMQPEAIESFFDLVAVHSAVTVVNQPIKVGWRDNDLYVEVHEPLQDEQGHNTDLKSEVRQLVEKAIVLRPATVDWSAAEKAAEQQVGYPIKIGEGTGPIPTVAVPLNPATVIDSNKTLKKKVKDPAKKAKKTLSHKSHFWE